MKFDLKELNPGAWFSFPDGDGKVCLRICDIDILDEIRRQTAIKEVEYKDGQRFEFQVDSPELKRLELELTYDYCIIDWKNINDAEGKPIPCNKEMKILLMGKSVRFSRFVAECLVKLSADEASTKKKQEKNS